LAISAKLIGKIVESKQVEQALKKSEKRFRRLSENASDMIYRMSLPEGVYEYVSPASSELFGYAPEEFYENSLLVKEVIHPDWHDYFEKEWENLVRGNVPLTYEYQIVHKDRSVRWINQRNTLERDDNGNLMAIEGVVTDITERKIAEEALVSSKSQLRILIDTIPDLIWLKDPNGVYISCNRKFELFFGAQESEIVGRTDYDFVDTKLADCFRAHDKKAIEQDSLSVNEEVLAFSDVGYRGIFETIKTPMRAPDGSLIGVLGVARDITDRKKMEEDLLQNDKRYKSAQRMGLVGNWEYNLVSETFWGSVQTKRIYGFEPDSDCFTTEEVENCIVEREKVHQALVDLIENDTPYNLEFAIYPVTGPKLRMIRSIAEVSRDEKGNPLKVIGVIQDITSQKEAEKERKKLESQLIQAQKMESVGRLAGGVAHDFNNMLSVILGYGEMILEKTQPENPLHEYAQEILAAGIRSTSITRQLLAFARKQIIDPQVLDLNKTAEDMLKMLRRLIGEDINLAWLPASVWPVSIDPSQLDQILANLCVNARDAIDGVGKITIETATKTFDETYCSEHPGFIPGDFTLLSISDDGCGMDKDVQIRVFEPFFTTKEQGKGTGLGLSTVYGIVKQNNGFINVYSEPGKGTTFRIYLPRHGEQGKKAEKQKTNTIPRGQGEIVLVVEDEASILKLTAKILNNFGYVVITANSPKEAVNLVKGYAETIDLLLTDVVMPEMNGRDLLNVLLTIQPNMKCLFMSGYASTAITNLGVLAVGMQFIQKPFSANDLAAKVHGVFKNEQEKKAHMIN
jgi:two-component system, cell cycle sensor histidine kinase and response regulator CckA